MRNWINIMESVEPIAPYTAELYHGTTETFTEFDFDQIKSFGPWGSGVYLSNSYSLGKTYSNGGEPMVVRVTLAKPYYINLDDFDVAMDQKKPFRSAAGKQDLLDQGYDGVVVTQDRYVEVAAYRGAKLEILGRHDINEAVEMVSLQGYNQRFRTLRDPSPKALMSLANGSKYQQLRFLIDDGHIWFWDAHMAVHQIIAACLGVDYKAMTADSLSTMTGVIEIRKGKFNVGHINGKGSMMATMTPEQWDALSHHPAWIRYMNGEIDFVPCYDYMDL
jgi:hypothetical protein